MKRAALAVAALSGLGLAGCPSGYRFRSVPGEGTVQTRSVIVDLTNDACTECDDGLMPLVHCEADPSLCRRELESDHLLDTTICSDLSPLLTFVHMSDAQLKEHQVQLDGPLGVRFYDGVVSGAGRDPELERYDFAVLLATVLGVNHAVRAPADARLYAPCPAPLAPSFVLHTGDAMDAGMFSELYEFLGIMNQLDVPFYNAVGNHDVLFFGTFPKDRMKGLDVTLPFVPVGDVDRILRAHHPEAHLEDFSIPYRTAKAGRDDRVGSCRSSQAPIEPDCKEAAPGEPPHPCWDSRYSGFDLICAAPQPGKGGAAAAAASLDAQRRPAPSFPRRAPDGLCPQAHGYYGQDFWLAPASTGAARKVRLLVLNTTETGPQSTSEALEQRSRGRMREEQYLWLERELASHHDAQTLFIVAGHHTLTSFVPEQRGWLQAILIGEPRVAVYLSGHTHVANVRSFERPSGARLWEVTAGSTLVYPQLANFVDLLERPTGEVYVRVRSFRQRMSDAPCAGQCDLGQLAARGRLGAFHDRTDLDWRAEASAARQSNGIFRVGAFR